MTTGQPINSILIVAGVLFLLGVMPFLFMMTTSFVKLVVVFSLIRSALGTQQIPPNQVITGLSMILTIYIMMPVGLSVYHNIQTTLQANKIENQEALKNMDLPLMLEVVKSGQEPVREFLVRHSSFQNRTLFVQMSKRLYKDSTLAPELTDRDFWVIIPAFMITELSEAFQIGFMIFLPFLVVDMVVSNILLSLGMFQLSPVTVSLPFKLLLFVLVDGWALIIEGLVKGYM